MSLDFMGSLPIVPDHVEMLPVYVQRKSDTKDPRTGKKEILNCVVAVDLECKICKNILKTESQARIRFESSRDPMEQNRLDDQAAGKLMAYGKAHAHLLAAR